MSNKLYTGHDQEMEAIASLPQPTTEQIQTVRAYYDVLDKMPDSIAEFDWLFGDREET